MKIIVDAFGGDNAPLEILKGCAQAVKENDFELKVVGNSDIINDVAGKNGISLEKMEIVHAEDVITMSDQPTEIMKSKKDSSMAVGLRLLASGEGDAFVSAGNSGALVVGATMIVKRIKGIKRPAFAPVIPKDNGFFMLIDSGANVECKPQMLKQFGIMGSIYMRDVMGVKNPRVGLVNVGTEEHKGTPLQHGAYELLSKSGLNFVGNVESREITFDAADVVVTDGFTGNIILKLYEGVATNTMGKIKNILKSGFKNKIAGMILKSDMKKLKRETDYNEYGGAPIIGLKAPVFKAHGSSKANTFKNALRLTGAYVKNDVVQKISDSISSMIED